MRQTRAPVSLTTRSLLGCSAPSAPPFLALLLLRDVMSDDATGRGAENCMMTGHVPGDAPYGGSLEASLRFDAVRSDDEHEACQRCGKPLQGRSMDHAITPDVQGGGVQERLSVVCRGRRRRPSPKNTAGKKKLLNSHGAVGRRSRALAEERADSLPVGGR